MTRADEDYLHWQATDRKLLARMNKLIGDAQRHPFEVIGKPEALRHGLAGWSHRIKTNTAWSTRPCPTHY